MWGIKVDKLPEKNQKPEFYNSIRAFLDEVMNGSDKYIEVLWDDGEYASIHSIYNTINSRVKKYGYPMKIHKCRSELFIERLDI